MNSALTKQDQVRLIVDQTSLLGDVWMAYEAGKSQLQDLELSPAEYELAIKRMAETLGIQAKQNPRHRGGNRSAGSI